MSAAELIEQIKALPRKEQEAVVAFVHELEAKAKRAESSDEQTVTDDAFQKASATVFANYGELLKKLAS